MGSMLPYMAAPWIRHGIYQLFITTVSCQDAVHSWCRTANFSLGSAERHWRN